MTLLCVRGPAEKPTGTEAWHERVSGRYACALLIAFVAAAVRLSLNPLLGTEYAYIVFYPALMIAATVCGFVPGVVSAAAMMTASVLWLHPQPLDRVDAVSLVVFAVSAIIMCVVGGLYRRYRGSYKLLRIIREESAQRDRAERDLKETQSELAEDLANSRRLHNLALRYVSEGDLDTVLKEILDAAVQITHAQKGTLQFFDAATGALQIRAAQGFSPKWLGHFQNVHGDAATCGEAMRTRARVVVPDVRQSPIFAGTPSLSVQLEAGVLAVQSTPLVSRSGDFLGMISTHFGEPHTPKDAELHWIDLLCRQAAELIERGRSEQALRESEHLLRTVTAEARVGLVVVDKERRYIFANQTYVNLLALPESELVGKRVSDVLGNDYDQIAPNLDRAFQGERVTYELTRRAAGEEPEERFFEIICEPRVNDAAVPYVVVVMVDITGRKKMQQVLEQTVQQRTARLRETIQELETFSYSIAHDMRAPLRSMQGFAKILQEEHRQQLDDAARDHLGRIIISAERLDALIQDVLNYSKIVRSDLPLETVQTDEFIHQIVDSYPNLQAHKAEIHVQEPLPPVLANQAALTQVISNLLGNAVKFTRPGIEADVHVRAEVVRKPQLSSQRSPPGTGDGDGEHDFKNRSPESSRASNGHREALVRLWFEDNGIGIRKDFYERIFGMFERLNAPEEFAGTGMGLTIVRKAVERMGGAVGVESEPGKGSRFWIELQLGNGHHRR